MPDEKKNRREEKEVVYPTRERHVYNGHDIPDLKTLDLKYENLVEHMRIFEYAMMKIQNTVYGIDEDYQLAKHKQVIACMCCPFFHGTKECKGPATKKIKPDKNESI